MSDTKTSGENLPSDSQSCDGGSICLDLALEGERLCKAGDCRAGVAFFRAAIKAGTDDLRTLSAIYSQLGNAYFYLGEYKAAVQYHEYDLALARGMDDKLGEAKASGNLGNTFKVMGKFAKGIQYCKRHLEIARELGDTLSMGRALYNLGNVYHAQGKHLGRVGRAEQNEPGYFPQEGRESLIEAVKYYEANLKLMRSLNDQQAVGRACGNLGNTCYLLGDFARAVDYHKERLHIARDTNDLAALRRAHSNLGNAYIFVGQFEQAAVHYRCTLAMAENRGDAAAEAQACYSLGNTYTLLREYRTAEEFHTRHLEAARELGDRVGEGRACWSLGNAHAALGHHEKALYFATEHYNISKELDDSMGMATAQMNIDDLRKVLGLPDTGAPSPPESASGPHVAIQTLRVRRQSMEQLALIQITPDGKKQAPADKHKPELAQMVSGDAPTETFFELLSRCQSSRMDEQRATLQGKEGEPRPKLQRCASAGNSATEPTGTTKEEMLDMVLELQSDRMESQRAELAPTKEGAEVAPAKEGAELAPSKEGAALASTKAGAASWLPGIKPKGGAAKTLPEEDFFDMIVRVQGSRLEDQRTEMPRARPATEMQVTQIPVYGPAEDVPELDFFALMMRAQSKRMDDQRASIPLKSRQLSSNSSSSSKK